MKTITKGLLMMGLLLCLVQAASAQTPDDVIEKHLAAIGGRAALAKLTSRSIAGTITASTPGGDVTGPVELLSQRPNKSRTFIKVDLSSFGLGEMIQDQRFDGTSGFAMDTLQGNRDITGNPLENLRNGSFPTPLLSYKEAGAAVELGGKEKLGEREAYLLIFTPKSGSVVRQYLDVESYLPLKTMVKVNVPQLGGDIEQTTEFFDYREVDGVKIPFQVKGASQIQSYTIQITKVEHNIEIDQALFSKPAAVTGK